MTEIMILTPAYNRAGYLRKLYQSLVNQTNPSFEWLVIDDGSRDETEQMIAGFQTENLIRIHYVRQANGGKHRALNKGIGLIKEPLTFIVDSDDYLLPDAVEIILKTHRQYQQDQDLCGYSFLRVNSDGEVNTACFPIDGEIDTFRKVRINGRLGGDKAEVFYTAILQRYPFPEFEGEQFFPEDGVWMQMSGEYKMVHLNRRIYVCDYLTGGLTKSGRKMKIHSPGGMIYRSLIYLNESDIIFRVRVKMMMLYIIYSRFAGITGKEMMEKSVNKGLFLILYLPASVLHMRWKTKYENEKNI